MSEMSREQVEELLLGMGLDECESKDGWWETSTGAAFGADIKRQLLAHDAALRARIEELERENTETRYAMLLDYRGIESPCASCGGMGTRVYGSTATWRHGIGGQSVTTDVCDKCWGSGDNDKPWRSWKQIDTLTAKLEDVHGDYAASYNLAESLDKQIVALQQQLQAMEAVVNDLKIESGGRLLAMIDLQAQLQQREDELIAWKHTAESTDALKGEIDTLDQIVVTQRATITRLLDALGELYDVQNGPPLETTAVTWQMAMDKAKHALA